MEDDDFFKAEEKKELIKNIKYGLLVFSVTVLGAVLLVIGIIKCFC